MDSTSGTIICLRCAEPLGAIKYGLDDLYPLCHDCAFPKAKAKCQGCREQAAEIERLRDQHAGVNLKWSSDYAKAQAEIARLREERDNAETVLACVADSMNTYLREENAEEVTKYRSLDLRDGLDRLVWAMRRRHERAPRQIWGCSDE